MNIITTVIVFLTAISIGLHLGQIVTFVVANF